MGSISWRKKTLWLWAKTLMCIMRWTDSYSKHKHQHSHYVLNAQKSAILIFGEVNVHCFLFGTEQPISDLAQQSEDDIHKLIEYEFKKILERILFLCVVIVMFLIMMGFFYCVPGNKSYLKILKRIKNYIHDFFYLVDKISSIFFPKTNKKK